MAKHTPGPWFVAGVRFRMNGSEWIAVNKYNEPAKRDDNIACVGYDPRNGDGQADARLIAAAPMLLEALQFVDTWVSKPVGAYSVAALDGLFLMTRDRITAAIKAATGDE